MLDQIIFPMIAPQGGMMEKIFFEGFSLQASLIFALGAQNLFVLESGMKKANPVTVSFVCFLCDLALILLGVAGAATIFNLLPSLKIFIGVVGVGFLFVYGFRKLMADEEPSQSESVTLSTWKKSAILAMTFSIVNPHAYLDAFVLIGGYSSKYADLDQRLMLGLGAAIYSGVWFLVLSKCSSFMKPFLTDRKRMKVVSLCTGSFLIFMSVKLSGDIISWLPASLDLTGYDVAIAPAHTSLFTSILF